MSLFAKVKGPGATIRGLLAALMAGLLAVAPVAAQDKATREQQLAEARAAIEAAAIEQSTYQLLWCGAVLALDAEKADLDSLPAIAEIARNGSAALYGKARNGPLSAMPAEASANLIADVAVVAKVTSTGAAAEFSRDECSALLQ